MQNSPLKNYLIIYHITIVNNCFLLFHFYYFAIINLHKLTDFRKINKSRTNNAQNRKPLINWKDKEGTERCSYSFLTTNFQKRSIFTLKLNQENFVLFQSFAFY